MKEKEMKKLGMQTKFVFAAPKWWISALLITVFSALFGFGITGLVLLALPAYLSGIFTQSIAKLIKVRYWLKTELFLSLFCTILTELIFALFFLVSMSGLMGFGWTLYGLLMAFTLPVWLRHVYISSIITNDQRKALMLSLSYPISTLISFSMLRFTEFNTLLPSEFFILYLVFLFISLLFAYALTTTMDRPLRRVLGVGGLEFTRLTLDHYKERTEEGRKRMEELFSSLGEYAYVDIFSISFWKEKLYGVMGVHTAHMGPFGELGGSDMPRKLSKIIECENFVSPHGASTHEMNPVSFEEVEKIADALKPEGNEKKVKVSKSVKIEGKVKVMAQRFGDWLLVTETSSPHGTEDIDPSVARILDEKIRSMGYEGLIFIDAHNCSSEHADETFVFSKKYPDMESAVLKAGKMLINEKLGDAKLGIGTASNLGIGFGIGPMGIKSLVIDVEGQKTAYIVIDGNNMVRGLRENIIAEAEKYANNAEVMTTDNHYVNRVYGGTNPVGAKGGREKIIEGCVRSLKSALGNLEKTDVRIKREKREIRTFGHGTPVKMITVSESVSAMGKSLAFLDLLSLVLLDILLAMLI